jgi:hypothetical protein
MKTKLNGMMASPFGVSSERLEKFSDAIGHATERGQAMIESGMKNWESEVGRYFEEFSVHSRETLHALGKCKAPMDVFDVEQKWLQARAQAYLESGKRYAQAFADVARTLPAECAATKAAIEKQVHKV